MWPRVYLQQQAQLKDSCVTKAHPSMSDSSQKNLKTWSPLNHPGDSSTVGECPFQLAHWSKPLPGSSPAFVKLLGHLAGLCFFLADGLASGSSRETGLSESRPCSLAHLRGTLRRLDCLYTPGDEGDLVNLVSFRNFLKPFF